MYRQPRFVSCVVLCLSLIPSVALCDVPKQPTPSLEPGLMKGVGQQQPLSPSALGLLKGVSPATPLGFQALAIYSKVKAQPFESNVKFSNDWIRGHISYYDKTPDREYKSYVAEMIDGGGDVALGMRKWLSDPKNVAWWDKTILKNAGTDGYARLVALNAAFGPGSASYRLTFGGSRRYDPVRNVMALNGYERPGVKVEDMLVRFPANASVEEQFATLVKFGASVRVQLFNFYAAYQKGAISQKQVSAFNDAFLWTGGCAVTNTEVAEPARLRRYLNGLNLMAITLGQLGFRAQAPRIIAPNC